MVKIGYKKIDVEIPADTYISKIESIIGKVKNITIEAIITDFKVYEIKDTMFVILNLEDNSGKLSALLLGNRDDEFKSLVKSLVVKERYRIRGSVAIINEEYYDEFETTLDIDVSFKEYILNNKLLCVRAIQKLNEDNSTKMFGINLVNLYDYDLSDAYDLVRNKTNYLNNIAKEEVKQIMFSYHKDIIILLENGAVLLGGIKRIENIRFLFFLNGVDIFAISNNKEIIPLISENAMTRFINNENYQYKKIVTSVLNIVALTHDGEVKAVSPCIQVGVDYTRFSKIDDIGYALEDEEIVIVRGDEIRPLFLSDEDKLYDKSQIILEGNAKTKDDCLITIF